MELRAPQQGDTAWEMCTMAGAGSCNASAAASAAPAPGGWATASAKLSAQVILPPAPGMSNEGGSSPLLALAPAVSWPWVPAWGSLEPCRRGGENAQKTGENGGKMGEIWSKKCGQGKDRAARLLLRLGLRFLKDLSNGRADRWPSGTSTSGTSGGWCGSTLGLSGGRASRTRTRAGRAASPRRTCEATSRRCVLVASAATANQPAH